MGRRWVPIVIVVVGGVLGLAVAGFPSRTDDAPIKVQAVASTSTSTSVVKVVTTVTTVTPTSVTTAVRSPADVRVTVLNASAISGSATRVGVVVKSLDYNLKAPGADRKAQDTSVVMYRPGYDNEARALANGLGLGPGVVVALDVGVVSPDATDLAVLVGTDLAKRTA